MFMSIYGVSVFEATAIGWGWGVSVLAISTVMFMVLDVLKVLIIRNWSFELTAKLWPTKQRVAELHRRRIAAVKKHKVTANIEKMRRWFRIIVAVSSWKSAVADGKKRRVMPGTSQSTVVDFMVSK